MNFLGLVKIGANIALGIGSEAIIGEFAKQAIANNSNKVIQVCTKFTSIALAGVVTTVCSSHVNAGIDSVAASVKGTMDAIKASKDTPQEA